MWAIDAMWVIITNAMKVIIVNTPYKVFSSFFFSEPRLPAYTQEVNGFKSLEI